MTPAIVNIATRPDLVPVVAGWLFEAFWRQEGHGLAEVVAALEQSVPVGMPQSFVLLAGGEAARRRGRLVLWRMTWISGRICRRGWRECLSPRRIGAGDMRRCW